MTVSKPGRGRPGTRLELEAQPRPGPDQICLNIRRAQPSIEWAYCGALEVKFIYHSLIMALGGISSLKRVLFSWRWVLLSIPG